MQTVSETYNKIANHFSNTRYRVWTCTSEFLDSIESGKCGLEVGCGNGKNLLYRSDLKLKGIDICENFVKICHNKNLDVIQGNMTSLPFEDNSFDFVFSIAAVHHLNSEELRIKAIKEMFRVCKPNGLVFVYVWAFEQSEDARRKFKKQDELVSWVSRDDGKTYYRYYHLYRQHELLKEFQDTNYNFEIIKDFYELGNWGIICTKN
jgi:ubiquinone/menaquinone biosynthesis C-methylase UbiE